MCRQIQKQAKHEIDLEALIDNTEANKKQKDITQVMTNYLVNILKVI